MTARLCIDGTVVDETSGAGLAGLVVRAIPANPSASVPTDLARSTTDRLGAFHVEVPIHGDVPAIRFLVDIGSNGLTHATEVVKVGELADELVIAIPGEVLDRAFPTAMLITLDDEGPTDELQIGRSLEITANALRPSSPHTVELRAGKETLSTQLLMSDALGVVAQTIVAPQFGLTSARGKVLSVREAQRLWAGKVVVVELWRGQERLASRELPIAARPRAPLGFVSDASGRLRNAVDGRRDDVFLTLVAFPRTSSARVFVVPRQGDWVLGDPIEPVVDSAGRPLVVDVEGARTSEPLPIAGAGQLAPGAYDLIARPVRYGFEMDERLVLHGRDVVIGRRHTGLVVREELLVDNPVLNSPTNAFEIAGSSVSERPYFRYRDTFAVGEPVWAAMDPGIVPAVEMGHKVAFYLIQSKTPAQWSASTALAHVPFTPPPEVVLQSSCINVNKTLVWAAAGPVGNYDIVADFGNNDPNPAAFLPDGDFEDTLDMIDGYFSPGFRVVEDPGTMTEFANVGAFTIDAPFLTAMGEPTSLTVDDESGWYFTPGAFATVSRTFQREALVRFPADVGGATSASQISAARPDYPLVVVVHGNGHYYANYGFLLDHLAANGFVAMSIYMPSGLHGLARANAFFNHLALVKTIFGPKLQNNVGVLGHSRGGEAVFKIARLNQSLGLGIGLNAMFALAPTDQYGRETISGAAATPLHVLYGAKDADVSGWPPYAGYNVRQSGFSLYDRTDDKDKSMTFVEDATHNGFVTTNEFAPAPLLAEADQRRILLADANGFFRMALRGEAQWTGMLNGEWRAPSVASSPAKTHVQYRSTNRRTVDDFEGAHTPTSWQTSTIGGANAQTGLPATPVEAQLYPNDNQSPHDSGGLRLGWDTTTDRMEFALPAGQRDVSGFATLSFSVTRVAGSAANPLSDAQNLRVTLADAGGNERSIRVSAFGSIPVEAAANTAGNVKSAMTTIRVPLAAYEIVCAGTVPVDLTNVVGVTFGFTEKPTGEIALDNVEFSS